MLSPTLPKKDSFAIEKAFCFLIKQVNIKCTNDKPLIFHSIRVGVRLFELKQSKDVIIAGVLHDLLEDTDCNLKQIKTEFGPKVAKLVEALTFDPTERDYKKRWSKEVKKIIKQGQDCMLIKVVDIFDNLSYYLKVHHKENKLKKELLWKNQLIINQFQPYLGNNQFFIEYVEEFNKIIKKMK